MAMNGNNNRSPSEWNSLMGDDGAWDAQTIATLCVAVVSLISALVASMYTHWRDKKHAVDLRRLEAQAEKDRAEAEKRMREYEGHLKNRMEKLDRKEQRAENWNERMSLYRRPLLQCAFDLQSRCSNQVKRNFVHAFCNPPHDTPSVVADADATYAKLNTMYCFAEFFCWLEIIRTEITFIVDTGDCAERTLILSTLLDTIKFVFSGEREEHGCLTPRLLQPDCESYDPWHAEAHSDIFQLYAGEMRMIGETMMVEDQHSRTNDDTRFAPMPYSEFAAQMTMKKPSALDHEAVQAKWIHAKRLQSVMAKLAWHMDRLAGLKQQKLPKYDASSSRGYTPPDDWPDTAGFFACSRDSVGNKCMFLTDEAKEHAPVKRATMLQVLLCKLIDVLDDGQEWAEGRKYDSGNTPPLIKRNFRLVPLVDCLSKTQFERLEQIFQKELMTQSGLRFPGFMFFDEKVRIPKGMNHRPEEWFRNEALQAMERAQRQSEKRFSGSVSQEQRMGGEQRMEAEADDDSDWIPEWIVKGLPDPDLPFSYCCGQREFAIIRRLPAPFTQYWDVPDYAWPYIPEEFWSRRKPCVSKRLKGLRPPTTGPPFERGFNREEWSLGESTSVGTTTTAWQGMMGRANSARGGFMRSLSRPLGRLMGGPGKSFDKKRRGVPRGEVPRRKSRMYAFTDVEPQRELRMNRSQVLSHPPEHSIRNAVTSPLPTKDVLEEACSVRFLVQQRKRTVSCDPKQLAKETASSSCDPKQLAKEASSGFEGYSIIDGDQDRSQHSHATARFIEDVSTSIVGSASTQGVTQRRRFHTQASAPNPVSDAAAAGKPNTQRPAVTRAHSDAVGSTTQSATLSGGAHLPVYPPRVAIGGAAPSGAAFVSKGSRFRSAPGGGGGDPPAAHASGDPPSHASVDPPSYASGDPPSYASIAGAAEGAAGMISGQSASSTRDWGSNCAEESNTCADSLVMAYAPMLNPTSMVQRSSSTNMVPQAPTPRTPSPAVMERLSNVSMVPEPNTPVMQKHRDATSAPAVEGDHDTVPLPPMDELAGSATSSEPPSTSAYPVLQVPRCSSPPRHPRVKTSERMRVTAAVQAVQRVADAVTTQEE